MVFREPPLGAACASVRIVFDLSETVDTTDQVILLESPQKRFMSQLLPVKRSGP